MEDDKNELKPCPFCGGKAELYASKVADGLRWVTCTECYASGEPCDDTESAIRAWNRRAKDERM